jgi:hypothetical protein
MPNKKSRKPWGEGKVPNPAVYKAVEEHRAKKREDFISCDLRSPSYDSQESHSRWRTHFNEHTGGWPPKAWVTPEEAAAFNGPKEEQPKKEVNTNLNEKQFNPHQGNWRLDIEQEYYDRDPRKDD